MVSVVLTVTNNAAENVRERSPDKPKDSVHTFDSFFNPNINVGKRPNLLKDRDMFVTEYSMVPNRWMTLLHSAFSSHNIKVCLYRDINQCEPSRREPAFCIDYNLARTSKTSAQTLQHTNTSETAADDEQTRHMLMKFLQSRRVEVGSTTCASRGLNLLC